LVISVSPWLPHEITALKRGYPGQRAENCSSSNSLPGKVVRPELVRLAT
jgi:hypothetical protein